jgi:hypothetical protein
VDRIDEHVLRALVHDDLTAVRLPHYCSVDVATRLSALLLADPADLVTWPNIYLMLPESGGELEIWPYTRAAFQRLVNAYFKENPQERNAARFRRWGRRGR